MFKLLLATALLIVGTQAAIVQEADCPATETQRFFISSFMRGKWYEQKRYLSGLRPLGSSCNTWSWTNNADNSVDIRFQGLNGLGSEMDSSFSFQKDPANSALLNYNLGLFGSVQYRILATDYYSYAVVYTCNEIPLVDITSQRAWVLTRSARGLNFFNTRTVNQVIEQNDLDPNLFVEVSQDSCPQFAVGSEFTIGSDFTLGSNFAFGSQGKSQESE